MMTPQKAHLFREVVDKSSAPLLVSNSQTGIIAYANQAAADLHGYTREELVGLDGYLITAEPAASKKTIQEKEPHTSLRWHRKKDGAVFPVEIFRGFFDVDGQSYVAITLFDITSRLQASNELKEQEYRWEVATEATNSGIWDWDLRTNYVFRSPRWYQMLGYEVGALPTTPWVWGTNLLHPDDVTRVLESRRLHIEGATPIYDIEHRVRCKDGSYFWCQSRGKALRDENGVAYRLIGFLSDINAFVEAREKLLCQNRALGMLHEISLSFIQTPALDQDKLFSLIAQRAYDLFSASHAFLSTLAPTGDRMDIRTSIGAMTRQTTSFVRGQHLSGLAWESGEIQCKSDYPSWPGRMPDLDSVDLACAITIPMKSGDRVVGVLSLGFAKPREFSSDELNILQQFATLAALITRTADADRKLEKLVTLSHRASFLNMLVSGDPLTRDELSRRAQAAGITLKSSYVAISVEREPDPAKFHESVTAQNPWLPFLDVIQKETSHCLIWERYSALNFLCPVDKDCPDIKRFTLDKARHIRTVLQNCLPELSLCVGIGNFYKDTLDIHRSFREAREALDTGRRLGGGDGLYHYLDIGIVQMLARMGQQGPIRAFVNNTIGRLLDYDQRRKGQFLPTLEMILTGKSLRIISEEMNVHQKTIVFRKMRIEEILNLPLDEGDVRLNLSIALKLHKLAQSIEAEKQTEPTDKKKKKPRRRRGEKSTGEESLDAELRQIEPDQQ